MRFAGNVMTIADKARDAAIHCEMKKIAYRQSKDGVVISFVLHPQEVPPELSTSHIGARYIAALVEIGDDEQPIQQPEKEKPKPFAATSPTLQPDKDKPAGEGRRWNDLQPPQQAGLRCSDATFRAYLNEERGYAVADNEEAAEAVREICNVNSRAELGHNHRARVLWHQLDCAYQAWKAAECH